MPHRAPQPCPRPGCPALLPPGGYCPEHRRVVRRRTDEARGTAAQRGYGSTWRRRRASFLARHPRCIDCGAKATVPDHDPYSRRDLVAAGVADPDADEFMQPRCTPCHNTRTAATTPGGWHRRRDQ